MKELRTNLLQLITARLGHQPKPEQVLEFLHNGGAMTNEGMRAQVVAAEFFRLYGSTDRTARDIEEELAVRFDLTREAIKAIRLRAAQPSQRKPMGRPRKV